MFDLLKQRTQAEISQMALDRTATYTAANIGYSRPLNEKWQINADVTAAHIDGTIASYGVDATPSTGNEIYYSTQLIGSSIVWDGDMFIAGARMADRQDSNSYVLDFGTRFPLLKDWRVNPRLLMSYREGKATEFTEISVLPSILLNYYWTRDLSFELEVGSKWTRREQDSVRDTETELFFTAGFRYDFYADGKGRCPVGSRSCSQ